MRNVPRTTRICKKCGENEDEHKYYPQDYDHEFEALQLDEKLLSDEFIW